MSYITCKASSRITKGKHHTRYFLLLKSLPHSERVCVSSAFSAPGDSRMDANRLDPPYGMWSHPAINKLATLTFVCTELAVSMCCCWTVGAQQEGRSFLLLPLSVPSSPPHSLSFSPTSSALESAVHLTPQIASDSRAISSRRFELNWSEQYHLCLLEGRCGSSCCSAERNREEGEVWWGRKERARRGVKKKKLLPATIKASVSHAICPAGSPVRRG